ncbi:MAG: hypothetical protein K0R28_5172, partial [Paenibacillus sp.]|nr:hypothetical protein [Paenibacillus sp.]
MDASAVSRTVRTDNRQQAENMLARTGAPPEGIGIRYWAFRHLRGTFSVYRVPPARDYLLIFAKTL